MHASGSYTEAESDAEKALQNGERTPRFKCRVARIYCESLIAVNDKAQHQAAVSRSTGPKIPGPRDRVDPPGP